MLGDSLFTDIVNFPFGIDSDNIFTVFANGQKLGEFSPGESVNFTSLLGDGVSQFIVAGLDAIATIKKMYFSIHFSPEKPSQSLIQNLFILSSFMLRKMFLKHSLKRKRIE
ncbi:MAG: hypothetical protein SWX82_31555 [Cyanobacteriota bacterium]|nr:hypothetical protein [Cyanobacteriota bacterium]